MKKETVIQIIIIIILTGILVFAGYETIKVGTKNNNEVATMQMQSATDQNGQFMGSGSSDSSSVETSGNTEITDEQTISGEYSSNIADESAIKVSDGGILTLANSKITKTGDSSNTENSEFYGVNAGILTTKGSTTTIKNSEISTSAKGANAVFATGENAKVYVSDTTITTTGESSARGLDSTYGGYIEADNVTISTLGGSCATLATDRGEGTVIARNSKLSTAGSGSPVIYSTGDITVENSEGSATGAQICVVEGKNTATIDDSVITCSGKGNRNNVDNCGIMLYQSMSGDAGEGTGTFSATNSTLEITSDSNYYKTSPFFFITNTKAIINLENNTLKYGSDVFLKIEGTSEWGNSGSNGGDVTLNAKNQNIVGNIEVDNISTVEINLKEGSTFEGKINSDNTGKEVKLNIDSNSTVTLTGNVYLTSFSDEDASYSNINFNQYTIYVNGESIK